MLDLLAQGRGNATVAGTFSVSPSAVPIAPRTFGLQTACPERPRGMSALGTRAFAGE